MLNSNELKLIAEKCDNAGFDFYKIINIVEAFKQVYDYDAIECEVIVRGKAEMVVKPTIDMTILEKPGFKARTLFISYDDNNGEYVLSKDSRILSNEDIEIQNNKFKILHLFGD